MACVYLGLFLLTLRFIEATKEFFFTLALTQIFWFLKQMKHV